MLEPSKADPTGDRTAVLVIGPPVIVASGIECLLDATVDELDVIDGGQTPEDALEKLSGAEISIILYYASSPISRGSELIDVLRDHGIDAEIAVVVEPTDGAIARACLTAGARACVATTSPTEDLLLAIRACRDRTMYVAGELDRDLSSDPVFALLTPRERDVLRLIGSGETSLEIASHLGIAYKTVDTHRQSLSRKLRSRGVADLVKHAIRAGLTDLTVRPRAR